MAHDVLLVLCWLVTANAGLHLTLMVEVHSTGKSLLGRGKFDYSRKNRQTKHTCPQGFLFAVSLLSFVAVVADFSFAIIVLIEIYNHILFF